MKLAKKRPNARVMLNVLGALISFGKVHITDNPLYPESASEDFEISHTRADFAYHNPRHTAPFALCDVFVVIPFFRRYGFTKYYRNSAIMAHQVKFFLFNNNRDFFHLGDFLLTGHPSEKYIHLYRGAMKKHKRPEGSFKKEVLWRIRVIKTYLEICQYE